MPSVYIALCLMCKGRSLPQETYNLGIDTRERTEEVAFLFAEGIDAFKRESEQTDGGLHCFYIVWY